MWDPRSDAWFAGFTDGEGSFNIVFRRRPEHRLGPALYLRFAITSRADDLAILTTLRDAFGGSLQLERGVGPKPCWTWCVQGKADLRRLVAYFDRFPLRAKKARDYAIWRRGVEVYLSSSKPLSIADELVALRSELIATRLFVVGQERVLEPEGVG